MDEVQFHPYSTQEQADTHSPRCALARAVFGNNLVLQQDNDPKHPAKVIKKYMENKRRNGSVTVSGLATPES